ncbi:MAG: transcription factor TFIIIB subunit brf1 [Phylliscum demangeonii]|nr:MAG: transcription factor TFIIIB subunit brf1 [Phylliscum demangeonii]
MPNERPMTRLQGVRNPPPIRRRAAAPAKRRCPTPACPNPQLEDDDGKLVCIGCGWIASETNIVSEVQFGEAASGAAVVQGSYVGADQSHARNVGSSFRRAGGMESREVTDANGKRYINQLAAALHIPPATSDMAFQVYKLAACHNFIQGRRTKNVAAVALYIACRKQKRNSVMLIDFADVLNVNVFKLGQTFKDFTKECAISGFEPVLPENLVYRFAARLEFGRLTEQVAQDAIRLVQRMDRDWMTTGRRPAGICGACLILAARMNNFRRTVREVVYVVKVADLTISKRLDEFKQTDSSGLTVEEFRVITLQKSHDPPIFTAQKRLLAKAKEKEQRRLSQDGGVIEDDEEEEEEEEGERNETGNPENGEERVGPVERPEVVAEAGQNPAGATDARPATQPLPTPQPSQVESEPRRDQDGFAIPRLPVPIDASIPFASASANAPSPPAPATTAAPSSAPAVAAPPASQPTPLISSSAVNKGTQNMILPKFRGGRSAKRRRSSVPEPTVEATGGTAVDGASAAAHDASDGQPPTKRLRGGPPSERMGEEARETSPLAPATSTSTGAAGRQSPPQETSNRPAKRPRTPVAEPTAADAGTAADGESATERDASDGQPPAKRLRGQPPIETRAPSPEPARGGDEARETSPLAPATPATTAAPATPAERRQSPPAAASARPAKRRRTPATGTAENQGPETERDASDGTRPAKRPRGRPPTKARTPLPEPDYEGEELLETEISQLLNDPSTQDHAEAYSRAQAAAAALVAAQAKAQADARQGVAAASASGASASASASTSTSASATGAAAAAPEISMTEEISDSEFAEDAEVANCVLTVEEQDIKERIWVHENKEYLREQQRKMLRRQLEEKRSLEAGGDAVKKVVRKRKRKGRIGEGGDGSVAASPAQATVDMLKRRGFSRKINYLTISAMFEGRASRRASQAASAAASTPAAGSPPPVTEPDGNAAGDGDGDGDGVGDRDRDPAPAVIVRARRTAAPPSNPKKPSPPEKVPDVPQAVNDEGDGDDDDDDDDDEAAARMGAGGDYDDEEDDMDDGVYFHHHDNDDDDDDDAGNDGLDDAFSGRYRG